MWAYSPGIEQERIVHLVAFRQELAIALSGMPVQKTLIDRVVDDFDVLGRDTKQFFDLALSKLGDRKNTRRAFEHSAREMEVQRTLPSRAIMRAIHVLQQIMHRDHIGTRRIARHPEKMGDVNQIALQVLENATPLEIALCSDIRRQ